jgi:hypothetical protein
MSRSSNLRAGRPKISFGLAGAVGPLRLIEPRSVGRGFDAFALE